MIRKLREKEIELFKMLRLTALKESPHAFEQSYDIEKEKLESYWKELVDSLIPPSKNIMLIAFEGINPIGFVYGFNRGKQVGGFGGMWVSEKYRRKGVGTKLVKAIEIWAKEEKLVRLTIWNYQDNRKAKGFYENYGFKKTGETKELKNGRIVVKLQKNTGK